MHIANAGYCYKVQTAWCGLSVCWSRPHKNGWVDRDAVWEQTRVGSKKPNKYWMAAPDLRGARRPWTPKLGPKQPQERPAVWCLWNARKPFNNRGSAPELDGELTALRQIPSWWEGLAAPSPRKVPNTKACLAAATRAVTTNFTATCFCNWLTFPEYGMETVHVTLHGRRLIQCLVLSPIWKC